jgi:hypothetical protein
MQEMRGRTLPREYHTISLRCAHNVCAVLDQQDAPPSQHIFQQHRCLIQLCAT